jgi:hypothetical protein
MSITTTAVRARRSRLSGLLEEGTGQPDQMMMMMMMMS